MIAVSGTEHGGWRLLAAHAWRGHDYALEFDLEGADSGCGTVRPDVATIAHSGGGLESSGRDVRYVYGTVLPPVERVRVVFEGGPEIMLEPRAAPGFGTRRFFAVVVDGSGGWVVEGLDEHGQVVPLTATAS